MISIGNSEKTPPDPQEAEISIFGPGFGECVVLHFGNGDWGVVDSCLEPVSKRPTALHYFNLINIDASKAVRFVLATHWHDDHIQGINQVFETTKSAIFSCSAAIRKRDFDEIMSSWTGTQFFPGGSGIDELHAVLKELKKRTAGTNYPSPVLALNNKIIWERIGSLPASAKALSPSDAALIAAMAQFQKIKPSPGSIRRRIPDIKPNNASVVLDIQIGQHRALLGADLETQNDSALGWAAIVNGFATNNQQSQGFKISHHASSTGHHDDVWNRMLIPRAWAATAPFIKGRVKLPTKGDCERTLSYTPNAYLTGPPRPVKFRDSNKAVEKTVNESTRLAHFIPGKFGHVRFRKKINATLNAPWTVELFGNAIAMADFLKVAR